MERERLFGGDEWWRCNSMKCKRAIGTLGMCTYILSSCSRKLGFLIIPPLFVSLETEM